MTDPTEHAGAKAKALEAFVELFLHAYADGKFHVGAVKAKANAALEVLIEVCVGEAEKAREREVAELVNAKLELQEQLAARGEQNDATRELVDGLKATVQDLLGRVAELEARRG